MMRSLKGQLLVASPFLADKQFARTVVLVLDHGAGGAVGVILNSPRPNPRPTFSRADTPITIDFGGPVAGPVIALHSDRHLAESELPEGLFVAWHRDRLSRLVEGDDRPYRLFLGHALWTEGQLENEIRSGAWMLLPATHEHVFGDDDQLWVNSLRQVGAGVIRQLVGERHWSRDVQGN